MLADACSSGAVAPTPRTLISPLRPGPSTCPPSPRTSILVGVNRPSRRRRRHGCARRDQCPDRRPRQPGRLAQHRRGDGLGHRRPPPARLHRRFGPDRGVAPYAFIAGAGVLPAHAAAGHGLGRAHFTAGAIAVLILALAAIVGLGRRVAVPIAGATVGLVAALAGVGLQLTKSSPAAGIAVTAAVCALAVELLPFAAMVVARFVVEPPTSGVEPGEFEGAPVNNYAVGLRVARTLDTLTGLTAGIGTMLVFCVVLLVVPIHAMQTAPQGEHTVWEQALAFLVSGVMLCRARLFRQRAQVFAAALSGLAGLVVTFAVMAANAEPDLRALWLAPLLVVIALLALGLASIRPRRGTSEPILPPRWSRTIDLIDSGVFLAVLPVLMAVLGVYGHVRDLKG
ncbi:hypothetical protein ACFQ9X_04955 [Catenulispora yoronensis]